MPTGNARLHSVKIRGAALRLAAAATLAVAGGAGAQTAEPTAGPARQRIAVVLSGGAARGLAHIGVLQVLEAEGIEPEIVTGASMGALVGGLYAIGYSPRTLDSLVTSLEWETYFVDDPERRFLSLDRRFTGERTLLDLPLKDARVTLPTGVIDGQHISELLARLTWPVQTVRDFRELPRAFAATATDVETAETVVLDSGSLAEALRASMSIPSLFTPVRVGGRLLIDGGITRNLPARDARALGADILICSDVSVPLLPGDSIETLVDVLRQAFAIRISASSEEDRALCDVYIQPSGAGLNAADFREAAEWIARGIDAAEAARPRLRAVAARGARHTVEVLHPPRSEPVTISGLTITGVTGLPARVIRRTMALPETGRVTAEQLDAAVDRAYATELFDRVVYRLEAQGPDTILIVAIEPREQDHLGIGLRYDDTHSASLLLALRLRNRIGFGSTTRLDLRLGEQLRISAQHGNAGVDGSGLMAGARTSFARTPIALFTAEEQTARAHVEVAELVVFAGLLVGTDAAVGVELKGEHARADTTPGISGSSRETFASGAVVVRWNTLDRPTFPMRGHAVSLRSEQTFAGPRFRQSIASAEVALPLRTRLAVLGRVSVGATSPAADVPLHYRFMLGGAFPAPLFPETQVAFVGLRPQQHIGTVVSRIGIGLRWSVWRETFVTTRADAGYVGSVLTLDADRYEVGVGLGVGAATLLGPMELSLGWRPGPRDPRLEVSLGHSF